jgi:CPA1 family monovalent cation:H+ antiporter
VEHIELILAGLLAAVAGLVVVARLVGVPYPILLVLGGLAIGFVPGTPEVELDPDLVLLVFLPPLLYSGGVFSSIRDLRDNLAPISMLAIGLVLTTMVTVAVAAHTLIDGMPWAAAFVLGAVVSPTDPVAATAIARRLGVPRRVVTVIEGEALINDATALVAYRLAVAAVVTGSFSLLDGVGDFLLNVTGGVAIGLAVGMVVTWARRRLDDAPVEITISLLTGYLAYLPAEEIGVSGVVAAVTVGVYMGTKASELITANTRLQSNAVWEILVFLLNSVLFILVGLQMPRILDDLSGQPPGTLLLYGLAVSGVVIATRIAWSFAYTHLPRGLSRRVRERDGLPSWQPVWIVAWTGLRGAVSLAAALAIPLETHAGAPFPQRDLIIFLTYCVILATLVIQGLSLPAMIMQLDLPDDSAERAEEAAARIAAAEAAIERVDQLASKPWVRDDSAERAKAMHEYRRRRFASRLDGTPEGEEIEDRSLAWQRLQHQLLNAQREALVRLRNEGRISDDVMRKVERDLDIEETRLEI